MYANQSQQVPETEMSNQAAFQFKPIHDSGSTKLERNTNNQIIPYKQTPGKNIQQSQAKGGAAICLKLGVKGREGKREEGCKETENIHTTGERRKNSIAGSISSLMLQGLISNKINPSYTSNISFHKRMQIQIHLQHRPLQNLKHLQRSLPE